MLAQQQKFMLTVLVNTPTPNEMVMREAEGMYDTKEKNMRKTIVIGLVIAILLALGAIVLLI